MNAETVIVAGDVGGTNTTIALMAPEGNSFRIVRKQRYSSQQLSGIEEAISDSLEGFRRDHPDLKLTACCFSAAGPVRDNRCKLTNVPWSVDGAVISELFGAPAFVINDFSAVCYGLPLLQLDNPEEVTVLQHPDGSIPEPHGDVMAAAGAGTGLGVGFLIRNGDHVRAFPTEAGHVDLAPVDDTMSDFYRFLRAELNGQRPGAELSISGMGISNLYRFFRSKLDGPVDDQLARIDDAAVTERPPLISRGAADGHPLLQQVMRYFVQMYANFASNAALNYIPSAGLFLAGGIAAKNQQFFLEDDLFMRTFLENYNPNIRTVIERIPVYIIRNYDVSLYGAANAARMLKE
ncbi:glucokinase [Spirochaeta africana]|uniref:Glucokinase n=1 Tax=Spirochaeta africana (strain ATCC 700263 / DSM 8902 / Z-7692) TaxID=889378 RepID=H9UIL0_SPIAZ|nr:glucokinase [Spirochaeta africana]AFG37353.1 glucokinase [Spirochaeta africana DSM 8902]